MLNKVKITGQPRKGYSHGSGHRNQGRDRRKFNPTGVNGMKYCPDSWENIRRVINIAEEENVVLFTGYNKEEIYQLGVDACNWAVLDSACSSTVCGKIFPVLHQGIYNIAWPFSADKNRWYILTTCLFMETLVLIPLL